MLVLHGAYYRAPDGTLHPPTPGSRPR